LKTTSTTQRRDPWSPLTNATTDDTTVVALVYTVIKTRVAHSGRHSSWTAHSIIIIIIINYCYQLWHLQPNGRQHI